MFYTYGEKRGNVFFDGWQMRQIAFDTMRRYLYYSAGTLTESQIANPMDNDKPMSGEDTPPSSPSPLSTPSTRRAHAFPVGHPRYQEFTETPPQPNLPSEVTWRKKMKVNYILMVAKDHQFILEDWHLKETDLFQIEVHGESRVLQVGEYPAPGPMLVPAAGWAGLRDRYTVDNDEYIADPYFLRELYEALRDQFTTLRQEREQLESTGRLTRDPRFSKIQTLQSPRGKNESASKGSHVKIVFRMRSEYEFRRFWYVVQTVLGYDKLGIRPYRGLPPYDPRNGLIFAQIPMCVWHTFKSLDKAVIYSFLRGDLVGRTTKGELTIYLRGCYMCITHDMVMVLRDTGSIPRWVQLNDVRSFEYNSTCHKPYLAFFTDPGLPDLVFIPQPPIYGPEAIRRFSPQLETLRVVHVVRRSCLASVEARRVIEVVEAPESSVRSFIERVESANDRPLNFDPATGQNGPLNCPLPKEQLAAVWREVQGIYAARDPVAVSQAAIPLYSNNTNDSELTAEQLETLERRMERERESRDDIVGMPIDEARSIEPPPVGARRQSRATSQDRTRSHGRRRRGHANSPSRSSHLRRTHTVSNGELNRMLEHAPATATTNGDTETSGADPSFGPPAAVAVTIAGSSSSRAGPGNGTGSGAESGAESGDDVEHNNSDMSPLGAPVGPEGEHMGEYVSGNNSFGTSVQSFVYGVPGARYITTTEMESGLIGVSPSQVVQENHMFIMGQTPQATMAGSALARSAPLAQEEPNVDELMTCSFALMRESLPVVSDSDSPPRRSRSGLADGGTADVQCATASMKPSRSRVSLHSTSRTQSGTKKTTKKRKGSTVVET